MSSSQLGYAKLTINQHTSVPVNEINIFILPLPSSSELKARHNIHRKTLIRAMYQIRYSALAGSWQLVLFVTVRPFFATQLLPMLHLSHGFY